eukprot:g2342.t1
MADILQKKVEALHASLQAYRGDADQGGAHDPLDVEASLLEQRLQCVEEQVGLIAGRGNAAMGDLKQRQEYKLLYHTLDKIHRNLDTVRAKRRIWRRLSGKDIKDGFRVLDIELTKRMQDLERLRADQRHGETVGYLQRIQAREQEQRAALEAMAKSADAQIEQAEAAAARLLELNTKVGGIATQEQVAGIEQQLLAIAATVDASFAPPATATAAQASSTAARHARQDAMADVREALLDLPDPAKSEQFGALFAGVDQLMQKVGRLEDGMDWLLGKKLSEDHAIARRDVRCLLGDGALLGRGGFGTVYRAEYEGSSVALKVIDLRTVPKGKEGRDRVIDDFNSELRIMVQLRNPRVVHIYGAIQQTNELMLVIELAPHGTVRELLDRRREAALPFDAENEELIRRLLYETACGMHYLVQKGVLHHDLKSPNLLFDANWQVKVSDFGLAKSSSTYATQSRTSSGNPRGSMPWMAPEYLLGQGAFDEKCDVYSFGVLLWELLTRKLPWANMLPAHIISQVTSLGKRPGPVPRGVPEDLKNLMARCWHAEPSARPTFGEIKSSHHVDTKPSPPRVEGTKSVKEGTLLRYTNGKFRQSTFTFDGTTLQYHSAGRAEGETLLLSHFVRLEEELSPETVLRTQQAGRKSIKLKPHSFALLSGSSAPVLLAAESAEEKDAWLDVLRGFARRSLKAFVMRLAEHGAGCCPWYHVPFDDDGEPSLAVHDASSQLLRLLGAEDKLGGAPLNFVTIFGQARQGKSTLMNQLASSEGLFAISHKDQTCTRGVDMSAKFMLVESFVAGSSDASTAAGADEVLHVGFVDVEGQGVAGPEYDTKLVTPALLFSKVLLFNWKGAPLPDMILDMLGVLAEAAESINLSVDDDGEAEARRDDIFGHLHIIFRDWTFASDTTARDLLKLEKLSKLKTKKLSKEAKKRNDIRETLLRVFTSVTIWTLPTPVVDISTWKGETKYLKAGFVEELAKLRTKVGEQLAEGPTSLGGKTLTCADLAELMPAVATAMNADDMLTPQGLFAQVAARKVARARDEYGAALRALELQLAARDTPAPDDAALRDDFDAAEAPLRAAALAQAPALEATALDKLRDQSWRLAQGANQRRLFEREKEDWGRQKDELEQRVRAASMLKNEALTKLKQQQAALAVQEERVAGLEADYQRKLAQIDEEAARKRSHADSSEVADRLAREAKSLKAQLVEAKAATEQEREKAKQEREKAKAADEKAADEKKARMAAEEEATRKENIRKAVETFVRGLEAHEEAERKHPGPITGLVELKLLKQRFNGKKAELEAVALEEMKGSTTADELAKLLAAMDEKVHTKEVRLATLSELGRPKKHVLTCAQCKELLGAIKEPSVRMVAVEHVGPRKDKVRAIFSANQERRSAEKDGSAGDPAAKHARNEMETSALAIWRRIKRQNADRASDLESKQAKEMTKTLKDSEAKRKEGAPKSADVLQKEVSVEIKELLGQARTALTPFVDATKLEQAAGEGGTMNVAADEFKSRMLDNNKAKAERRAREAVDKFNSELGEFEKAMEVTAAGAVALVEKLEAKCKELQEQNLPPLEECDTTQRHKDAAARMDATALVTKGRLNSSIEIDAAKGSAEAAKSASEKAQTEFKEAKEKLLVANATEKTKLREEVAAAKAKAEEAAQLATAADESVATKVEEQRKLACDKSLFDSARDNSKAAGCVNAKAEGADPKWRNPGDGNKTALLVAAQMGHEEVVAWLLDDAEVGVGAVDDEGSTALHLACANGQVTAAKLLLAKGADIAAKNKAGKTVSEVVAGAEGHAELKALLYGLSASTDDKNDFVGFEADFSKRIWGDREYTWVAPRAKTLAGLFNGWFKFSKVNDKPAITQKFDVRGASDASPVYLVVSTLKGLGGDAPFSRHADLIEALQPYWCEEAASLAYSVRRSGQSRPSKDCCTMYYRRFAKPDETSFELSNKCDANERGLVFGLCAWSPTPKLHAQLEQWHAERQRYAALAVEGSAGFDGFKTDFREKGIWGDRPEYTWYAPQYQLLTQYFHGYYRFKKPNAAGKTIELNVAQASEKDPHYVVVLGRSDADPTCDISRWQQKSEFTKLTIDGLSPLCFLTNRKKSAKLDMYYKRVTAPGKVIVRTDREKGTGRIQHDYVMGMMVVAPTSALVRDITAAATKARSLCDAQFYEMRGCPKGAKRWTSGATKGARAFVAGGVNKAGVIVAGGTGGYWNRCKVLFDDGTKNPEDDRGYLTSTNPAGTWPEHGWVIHVWPGGGGTPVYTLRADHSAAVEQHRAKVAARGAAVGMSGSAEFDGFKTNLRDKSIWGDHLEYTAHVSQYKVLVNNIHGYYRFKTPNAGGKTMEMDVKQASEKDPHYVVVLGQSSEADATCDIGQWAQRSEFTKLAIDGLSPLRFGAKESDVFDVCYKKVTAPGKVILRTDREKKGAGEDQLDFVRGLMVVAPTSALVREIEAAHAKEAAALAARQEGAVPASEEEGRCAAQALGFQIATVAVCEKNKNQ